MASMWHMILYRVHVGLTAKNMGRKSKSFFNRNRAI
jgi:hypothetical protein